MVLKATKEAGPFASEPTSSSAMKLGTRQINLLRGWPSTQLLPAKLVLKGAQNVLLQTYDDPTDRNEKPELVQVPSRPIDYGSLLPAEKALEYGPDPGHTPLRMALAEWLQDFYGPATKRAYPSAFQDVSAKLKKDQPEKAFSGGPLTYSIPYDRITLTGGASQSLGIILNTLTDPSYTRKVWIIAPAYFLAFNIFQDAGFAGPGRMAAVPELTYGTPRARKSSKRGPDVDWLRKALENCEREWQEGDGATEPQLKPYPIYKKMYKHVIYTVPSFSNPSSITMSLDVREEMVKCARDFDALIVCDDVYDMLQWPSDSKQPSSQSHDMTVAPLPRLVDIDRYLAAPSDVSNAEAFRYGNVVSNGTFSKIVGPGSRVGWVEASSDLAFAISKAGTTVSGGSPGHLVSTFLAEMLEDGSLQKHVQQVLRPSYQERWQAVIEAIDAQLVPLGVKAPFPHGEDKQSTGSKQSNNQTDVSRAGGYFIWLTLPDGMNSAEVARRCLDDENLVVAHGEMFQIPRNVQKENNFYSNLRLCFSWEALPELREGVSRLARVIKDMLGDSSTPTSTKHSRSMSGYA